MGLYGDTIELAPGVTFRSQSGRNSGGRAADSLVVECGGDLFGASVPEFLTCLKARRSDLKVVLVAADALGAIGAKQVLEEIGLAISLITGPCTETPTLRERTETLCGIPAINLFRSSGQGTQ